LERFCMVRQRNPYLSYTWS